MSVGGLNGSGVASDEFIRLLPVLLGTPSYFILSKSSFETFERLGSSGSVTDVSLSHPSFSSLRIRYGSSPSEVSSVGIFLDWVIFRNDAVVSRKLSKLHPREWRSSTQREKQWTRL